mgnify:CR=1 FL=1
MMMQTDIEIDVNTGSVGIVGFKLKKKHYRDTIDHRLIDLYLKLKLLFKFSSNFVMNFVNFCN